MASEENKTFLGCWVLKSTRLKFKMACAAHGVTQGDVLDLLIQRWMDKEHVREEIQELWESKKTEKQS